MLDNGFVIDSIKWVIQEHPRRALPLCPKDFMVLDSFPGDYLYRDSKLKCERCKKIYPLPRTVIEQSTYVLRYIDSNTYKTKKFINLDDESIPIAEDKVSKTNNNFFVIARLMKSKLGLRLVVYAGEKGSTKKTQIFVEPEIKRLAFDQNDLHPTDVFTSLEAIFPDGSKAKLKDKS